MGGGVKVSEIGSVTERFGEKVSVPNDTHAASSLFQKCLTV